MLIKIETTPGPIVIIVRDQTQERLAGTCFRGDPLNRAGIFSLWNDSWETLNDGLLTQYLVADARAALEKKSRTNSLCVKYFKTVGWSGTDDLEKYKPEDLETFNPNRHSCALRVKIGRKDLLAPVTNFVTLVYEIRQERNQIAIIVHSMYPGKDIGELHGNITEREKVVFFDWDHPGVPI